MSSAGQELPPAAVIFSHPVADWDRWKEVFDDYEYLRRVAGGLGHHINRGEADPNHVMVYMAVADVDQARDMATSEEQRAAMEEAGVLGPPEIMWLAPMREAVIWNRELPAMAVSHRVRDFDSWLAAYDAADELRAANGIVGHAANRSLDDPDVAVVYHQAESFEALRAFLANPELQAAMEAAGVASEPEVTFHTGGWAKQYV